MANELKITEIVDKGALQQVEALNTELLTLKATYAQIAIELGKQIKVPVADYQTLSTKANAYQTTLVRLNSTVKEMNEIQQKQVSLLNEVNNKMNSMNAAKNLANVFGKLADGVDKLNGLLDKLVKNHQQASQAIGSLGKVTNQVSQQFAEVSVNYTQLSNTLDGYSQDVSDLAKNITNSQNLLSTYNQQQKELNKQYQDGKIPLSEYVSKSAELKQRIGEVTAELNNNKNVLRNHSQAVVAAEGSYDQMNAAMLELQKRYKALSEADRESGIGQGILDQAAQLNGKLKEIDSKFGNYQRNVGNYASAFNGLGYQVTQVVRELPALNSGFNTFMIAIGNNLPMLVDEISRARELNAKLATDGQKTTPVWKQVTGAIFNWQTALVVGLTLITMYWKDISKFFKELVTGAKGFDAAAEAQKKYNEAMKEGAKNAGAEVAEMEILYRASQDQNRSLEERNKAIDKLQKDYPSYFGNMTKEEILIGKAKSAYDKLKQSIIEQAQARALAAQIEKISSEKYDLRTQQIEQERIMEENEAYKGKTTTKRGYGTGWGRMQDYEVLTEEAYAYSQAEKAIAKYNERISELDDTIVRLSKEINISAYIPDEKNIEKQGNVSIEKQRDILEELLQTRIDLIEDARQRELEQNEKDFKEKMEGLEKESELYKNYEELMRRNEAAINEKYDAEALKARQEAADKEVNILANKYAQRALIASKGVQNEMKVLSEEYAKGAISQEDYEEKLAKISTDYAIESAQTAIDAIKEQLNVAEISAEKRQELLAALANAELALGEAVIVSNEEQAKSREKALAKAREGFEALRDVADLAVEGMGDLMDGIYSIFESIEKGGKDTFNGILAGAIQMVSGINEMVSNMYESQIEELEKEQEAEEEASEKEIARIDKLAEHGAISEEEAEARKRAAEDKTAAKTAEVEKKKAELMTKQAKFEKAMNISQTIMATALAVTKSLPNIVLAALVGAMGAVQLATIISQPIPKYAKGTKDHKGGLAIVGDGGKREGVLTDKGLWVTPDTPTLIDLPKHAMVIPDIQKYLSSKGLQSDILNKRTGKDDAVIVNVNNDYTKLEREMMGNRGELKKLTKVVKKMSRASELRGIYGRI